MEGCHSGEKVRLHGGQTGTHAQSNEDAPENPLKIHQ